MKSFDNRNYGQLPEEVIDIACAGDVAALDRVLRFYDKYINKLCTRTLYDKYGLPCVRVDEVMKNRLQAKLVKALVEMK